MVLLLLKMFVVLKEFWLLLRACDIFSIFASVNVVESRVLANSGSVSRVEIDESGVDGKAFCQATTFQPLDLKFVTQTLEGDLCQKL